MPNLPSIFGGNKTQSQGDFANALDNNQNQGADRARFKGIGKAVVNALRLGGTQNAAATDSRTPAQSNSGRLGTIQEEDPPQTGRRAEWKEARQEALDLKKQKAELKKEIAGLEKQVRVTGGFKLSRSYDAESRKSARAELNAKYEQYDALKGQRSEAKANLKDKNQALWQGRRDDVSAGAKKAGETVVGGAKAVGKGVAGAAVGAAAGTFYAGKMAYGGVKSGGEFVADRGAQAGKAIYNGGASVLTAIKDTGVSAGQAVGRAATSAKNGMRDRAVALNDSRPRVQLRKMKEENAEIKQELATMKAMMTQLMAGAGNIEDERRASI